MDTPSGTSTPSGSTETSPAAPATSAPSSSPSPSQRPTFEQAFAADAASSSAATSSSTDTATTPPGETTADASAIHPSTEQGPIPFAVHKTALENRDRKAREAVTAEFDRDYGWAKQIPRASIERMNQVVGELNTDPVAFVETLIGELSASPQHAAALRSQAGRLLAKARGTQPEPMPGPDVQIVDANGTVTGETYSAAQLAKRDAWREQQLLAHVRQEYGPLKAESDRQREQSRQAAVNQQVEAKADGIMSELMDILDGDASHLAAVEQVWAANPTWSAHQAALHVRKTAIVPGASAKAEAKVLEDLKTKAASQGVNPSGAVVANTSRPTSFNDPRLKW